MRHLLLSLLALVAATAWAQNPVVQTCYTADPAALAVGDSVFLYTGRDEAKADFFWMQEWRVYATADMVNWTDHGSPLALEDFTWADDRAWASQMIERNGKFYWYICAHSRLTNAMAIGVAVGDTPTGPFRDAIGKPLADGSWDYIDPTVFIDDDGQAYLYWGNPLCYWAKLNDDMISLKTEIQHFPQTEESFGAPEPKARVKGVQYKDCYTEGPWIAKRMVPVMRRGKATKKTTPLYYLLYAAGGVPEHIAYSTAPTPVGPWTYRGTVMERLDLGSFTNHCGVFDFKGHSYFTYHTGNLPGGGGFGRSACIDEFRYNADGSIPLIKATSEGVKPLRTFSPFRRVKAETMAWSQGVTTETNDRTGVYLSDIHNGDYTKLQNVDFSARQARHLTVRAASALRGGTLELRTDSVQGPLVATVAIPHTGGWEEWQTVTAPVATAPAGTHDLYLVFRGRKGPKLFSLDWWSLD